MDVLLDIITCLEAFAVEICNRVCKFLKHVTGT